MVQLSDRQKEVLHLISDGLTSEEIAKELHISAHTVEVHRRILIQKFDAKNAASLIKKAFENGFLVLEV